MSTLAITPLNISGVSIPTNFLDNILGQSINYSKLVYPMDLATNPQYNHAVQFSVHDYTYPVVESEYQKLAGQFYSAGAALGKAASGNLPTTNDTRSVGELGSAGFDLAKQTLQNTNFTKVFGAAGAELSSGFNAFKNLSPGSGANAVSGAVNSAKNQAPAEIKQFLTDKIALVTPGSYRPSINDRALAYISLYMPDTLTTQIQSDYNPVEMTKTFGILGYGANMISDALKSKSSITSNPANLFSDDYLRGLSAQGIGEIAGKLGVDNVGGILGNAVKRVPNPQVQLLYRGLNLREFQFEFIFTPASAKEAEEVDQIIKTFTYYSLPDITAGTGNQFFIPPQVFRIKFSFMGDDGLSGQIYDIFKQNITNVFGNQFTKIMTGSNPTEDITAKTKNAKIFNIGDCVLENVSVNYAPLGTWASYSDGYPIQTTMTLSFKEMSLINKTTPGVAPKDTSAYSAQKLTDELSSSWMNTDFEITGLDSKLK